MKCKGCGTEMVVVDVHYDSGCSQPLKEWECANCHEDSYTETCDEDDEQPQPDWEDVEDDPEWDYGDSPDLYD